MSSLKQKSVVGIAWALTEQFGIYLIKFVIGIILARLLTPEDFGLVGMIMVFFAVAEVFVNSGFGAAYVHKKDATDADANTIFFTNLFISLVLYIILYFGAPWIASFYERPALTVLTRVMGLVVVINAFNIIQQAQIVRDVNFKRKAKVTVTATLISGTAGITSALMGMGVWALVIQSMANRAFIAAGLWITTRWTPKWEFSFTLFRELFAFGSWILFSSVIRKIFDNIYILAIGKFFPAAQVGFYTKAKQFERLASENLAGAIGRVAFPVYAKLQDDKPRLRNGMRKFIQHSMILLVPMLIGLIVVAEPFVILLLKEKWAPMIPYLQLMCIIGILYPINMVNIQAMTAQGKSRLSFKLSLLRNGLRIVNIAVMYRFGVFYIILGEAVISLVAFVVDSWFSNRLVAYGFKKQTGDISKILTGGIIAGAIAYLPNLVTENLYILFFSGVLLTASVFLLSQYVYNRKLLMNTIELKNHFSKK